MAKPSEPPCLPAELDRVYAQAPPCRQTALRNEALRLLHDLLIRDQLRSRPPVSVAGAASGGITLPAGVREKGRQAGWWCLPRR